MRVAVAVLRLLGAAPAIAATAVQVPYGTTQDGRQISQTILRNDNGMEVRFISYGAIITGIVVPDAAGRFENVALSFGNLADYEAKNGNYGLGATIGRYAGRIAGARFSIDGREVRLAANDGPNTLHGGPGGFDTKVWKVEPFMRGQLAGAVLSYSSPAGEQGFPGKLDVRITYTLETDNALRIDYEARSDAATAINFTNHSYFNLAGAGSGSVLGQRLQVFAGHMVATDARGIPTGQFPDVSGTPLDFREASEIGARMSDPAVSARGYNHSWMLPDRRGDIVKLAARMSDPASGRIMDVLTSEPSIHAYTAGYFSGEDKGAEGRPYRAQDALALETQHLSNAPNDPALPSTLLRPGEIFRSTTLYRFAISR